jgi:hypothetical protein
VARVETPLVRKLKKLLIKQFPPPSRVELEDHDGIVGVITSKEFAAMETIDRQRLIGDIITTNLSREERRQVQVIVGVTPEEGTGYLAGEA